MTIQMQRKPEYPASARKQIVKWLEAQPKGSKKLLAEALGVSDRTLRNWKKSHGSIKRRGRKQLRSKLHELLKIARQWKKQGYSGSLPVIKALPGTRVKLVREVVSGLKLRKSRRARNYQTRARVTVTVKQVGVVVAMDGATIRRGEDLIVVRDRGSLGVTAEKCHGSLRSENTLSELERLKADNKLPLVVCTDNGSPFCSKTIEKFLSTNQVIHLRSLPRVPQHNGSCENAVRELKDLLKFNESVSDACRILNEGRKRRKLGWKTSAEIDKESRVTYNDEDRAKFYEKTKAAIEVAVLGTKVGRERRKNEREAIFRTLEGFGLITRTRGDQTCASNR